MSSTDAATGTADAPKAPDARRPAHLPLGSWWRIAKRTVLGMGEAHLSLIAAGVAFYSLLAMFPAITALMAIAGLVVEPAEVTEQIDAISNLLPQEAATILIDQAQSVAGSEEGGLGLAAVLGLILTLYSASKGVGSLVEGLNVAYGEKDQRSMVKQYALNIALTGCMIVAVIIAVVALLVLPAVISFFPLGPVVEWLITIGRWTFLVAFASLVLGFLFYVGPDRRPPRFRWLTPGAITAVLLWIAASAAFTVYAANFGSYQETFGTLAGVVLLLMWLWISALVVLLGAKLNAEAEAETSADTTRGEDWPAGSRGAAAADRVEPPAD